ncbi:hypothetical protein I7I53_00396 [Histoplasma capsulatum var. duboisii H88]|uniref:Uncharacterized protein n=1 Tax=Ajellomyces capsulatus (strain H88) TaxID=544711 RepID=A0A8A1LKP2_AJEC8|nr:hypothetical protein I7I53_00396 [Histoplasma capsulatum var. duboisii H88]
MNLLGMLSTAFSLISSIPELQTVIQEPVQQQPNFAYPTHSNPQDSQVPHAATSLTALPTRTSDTANSAASSLV